MGKSDLTKQRILEAAEQEFSEKGLYGARVDEIAAKADINKRMLYQYFGNKEDLYKTVLFHVYKRIADIDALLLTDSKDSCALVRKIIRVYYDFLAQNPTFVRMIMWENLNGAQYLADSGAADIKDPAIRALGKIIDDGKEKGVFRENVDKAQVMLSLITFSFSYFSNIHTLSLLLKTDLGSEENMKKRVDYVANLLLNDLMNP